MIGERAKYNRSIYTRALAHRIDVAKILKYHPLCGSLTYTRVKYEIF